MLEDCLGTVTVSVDSVGAVIVNVEPLSAEEEEDEEDEDDDELLSSISLFLTRLAHSTALTLTGQRAVP